MKTRFQPANFFAILIAIILMVIGFALYFINKQMVSAQDKPPTSQTRPASMSGHVGLAGTETITTAGCDVAQVKAGTDTAMEKTIV